MAIHFQISAKKHFLGNILGNIFLKSARSPDLFKQRILVEDQIKQVTKDEFRLCQLYRKHNAHVINSVPKENLLVWNLKDGWEPLCKFLNKPIPGSSS